MSVYCLYSDCTKSVQSLYNYNTDNIETIRRNRGLDTDDETGIEIIVKRDLGENRYTGIQYYTGKIESRSIHTYNSS